MTIAWVSAVAGVVLALNHPLWPMGLLALLWCVMVVEASLPGVWLALVPACLPCMNFSPWTGWIVFDELDIMLLAVLAGGYGRRALGGVTASSAPEPWLGVMRVTLYCTLAVTGLWALERGVADAGGWAWDWFADYRHPLNSLRVFKSVGYALLLWPLLHQQLQRDTARTEKRFASGMVLGVLCVTLAVVWERAAFVGLWDFSSNYRTVALFWEMHVGGAAIDAYLAMATPFAVWAMVTAKRPLPWLAAATLLLLLGYACLTTFSRGVYLASVAPLVVPAYLVHRTDSHGKPARIRWRLVGSMGVVALLALEVALVLGGDTYMQKRLAQSGRDMSSRINHWQSGLGLLQTAPDWWLGLGLGRLPAHYANRVPEENFSGEVQLGSEVNSDSAVNHFVTLRTPNNINDLAGVYALNQRVALGKSPAQSLSMKVRVREAVDLAVLLCERHLLYDRNCQWANVRVEPLNAAWQMLTLPLQGNPLDTVPTLAPRLAMLAISVDTPGGEADIDNLQMSTATGQDLLGNGDFSRQMAQWLPVAQSYFVPWHIDNLYLEVLIERGWLGVLGLGALLGWGFARTLLLRHAVGAVFPYTAAALGGALVVGLVSSVLDVPRVALLFYLLPMLMTGCNNQTSVSI